jgi:hypothetical protein
MGLAQIARPIAAHINVQNGEKAVATERLKVCIACADNDAPRKKANARNQIRKEIRWVNIARSVFSVFAAITTHG